MSGAIYVCGSHCQHRHDGINGPTGCCAEHGPYLYFCGDCQDEWRAANPERAAQINRLARQTTRRSIQNVELPSAADPSP